MTNIDWEIVDEILDEICFFVDADDRYVIYAEYEKTSGNVCFYPVDSEDFEVTLRMKYRELSGSYEMPDVKKIIRYIKDNAIFYEDLDKVHPYCRVAGDLKSGIEYFLADKYRTVISIKDGKWSVTKDAEYKFLTTTSHLEQVMPMRSEKNIFELLKPCFNIHGNDFKLFVIWLIQCFCGGAHYGAMLSAERGSGKSTVTRITNMLIDPSKADTTILQTKLDDFQTFLGNHYLCSFDNIRKIPVDYSDTLAAAITGSTVAKRRLYSDKDMVYMQLQNVVMLNGIDILPEEADLAERFLYFRLEKISAAGLKSDSVLKDYITKNRAEILGCIFETLATATKVIKGTKAKKPTRMVKAHNEMLAIAKVLGMTEDEFSDIVTANVKNLHQARATSPLVESILEYMNGPALGQRKMTCSSTTFFMRVTAHYSGPRRLLPSRAAEFSKQLKKEHDALYAVGFQSIVDDTGADGSMITIIREKK